MSKILEFYQNQLEMRFKNAYMANGPAHQVVHFRKVYSAGLHINTELELNYDPLAIMTVAYLHDLFAWSRDNHHLLSYNYVWTTADPFILEILYTLKKREKTHGYHQTSIDISHRYMIAQACREHRANYDGIFTNTFSELMNSANRGKPKDIKTIVERTYRNVLDYNKDKTWPECMEIAVKHVKDKYSRTGYAIIPDMYKLIYEDELNAFWDDVGDIVASKIIVSSLDHSEIICWGV